jgi:hypothetical protein
VAGGADSRPLGRLPVSGWLTYGGTVERMGDTPAIAVHGVGVDGSVPIATWRSNDAGRRWAVTQTRR